MQIKHNAVRRAVRAWAVEIKRESVGQEIAAAWFSLGGGDLPLVPINEPRAGQKNQQNIFRWIDGDTELARKKVDLLYPAIITALPRHLSASLVLAQSAEYRALQMARQAVTEAADAYVAATVVDVVNHYTCNCTNSMQIVH